MTKAETRDLWINVVANIIAAAVLFALAFYFRASPNE